jgi:hypothetical protein
MQNNLIFNLRPDLAQAQGGAALVAGGAGAPGDEKLGRG